MAAIAIVTNLGFICITLGAVCGKAKTYTLLIVLICISSSLHRDADLPLCYHAEMRTNSYWSKADSWFGYYCSRNLG